MITRKLAKAIMRSPKYGEVHDLDDIAWVQKTVFVWPSCQPHTKIYIYCNDELVEACDLSWIRDYANG
jgi:hypothetical protein